MNKQFKKNEFGLNYCFSCEKSFYSMGNLNKHFKTKKHNKNFNKILNRKW